MNRYWDNNGQYQHLVDLLEAKIPVSGSVYDARRNPALERFRRACNVYYDIYNNGLCNRSRDFYPVFRFGHTQYGVQRGMYWEHTPQFYERVEHEMNHIIIDAAMEQHLPMAAPPKAKAHPLMEVLANDHIVNKVIDNTCE